jgi:hypothetical protein
VVDTEPLNNAGVGELEKQAVFDDENLGMLFDEEKEVKIAPVFKDAHTREVGDVVTVARVNKAKISYFFTERISDVKEFFLMGELELRITLGKKWENYIVVHKTPLLKQFLNFDFKRSTETHYSKNLMLYSDDLQGVNLRLTLGIALDKQTDVSDVPEEEMRSYLSDYILFPPYHYQNKDISMNIMPAKWFQMLSDDKTLLN